jgi:5-methylcytosine-specific restriction endonuclease McrA
MTCRVDHGKTVRDERLGVRRLWLNNNKAQRLAARQIAKNNAKPKPPKPVIVKNCPTCGGFVPPNRLKYCSKTCSRHAYKDTAIYKAHKKAWRLKRKAMDRGATVSDNFNPFKVFDRDGWKCQICGTKTPKSLRGTYKPNAPELDHILPIGKGGEHSYCNTQCACRRCNGAKSSTDWRVWFSAQSWHCPERAGRIDGWINRE